MCYTLMTIHPVRHHHVSTTPKVDEGIRVLATRRGRHRFHATWKSLMGVTATPDIFE